MESRAIFRRAEREENPQRAADRILNKFRSNNDDALVLIARLTGIQP